MPYEFFLAFRYLRSRHKRRLARVTAIAAVVGIAMGVAALIVAFALANGFRNEMRDKILQGTAHVSIMRSDGLPINDYESVAARVRRVNGVVEASATTYDGAMANGPSGSTYVVLRGVEVQTATLTLPSRWIREGSFEALFESKSFGEQAIPQVVVGSELATRLGVKTGDTFQVTLANTTAAAQRRLKVAGIFSSGLFEFDSTWIYVPLETVSTYAGSNHAAAVISVQVANVDDVKPVGDAIRSTLGSDFRTIDWQDANQPLFSALALERRMGLFIIGLIIAIAVINITTMLILVVVERRRDIAILSALGATRTSVMYLFLIEGGVVGAIGAASGVAAGLVLCFIGNYFKLVSLPADVYSISNVPLSAGVREVLLSALLAFGLSILATIYPALVASRMRPAEALRDA
ncbi:MAG TPA: ABC transporter permease [Pyrinomonadaceae bacterium]|nr:ABC transporter permease [Pyrinomonadaceae bacterium]